MPTMTDSNFSDKNTIRADYKESITFIIDALSSLTC